MSEFTGKQLFIIEAGDVSTAAYADAYVHWLVAELARQRAWVNDLHSGMYINCVYCGHRYGPHDSTPATMADVLKEHCEQCQDHPLAQARAEIAQLQCDRDNVEIAAMQDAASRIRALEAVIVQLKQEKRDCETARDLAEAELARGSASWCDCGDLILRNLRWFACEKCGSIKVITANDAAVPE